MAHMGNTHSGFTVALRLGGGWSVMEEVSAMGTFSGAAHTKRLPILDYYSPDFSERTDIRRRQPSQTNNGVEPDLFPCYHPSHPFFPVRESSPEPADEV